MCKGPMVVMCLCPLSKGRYNRSTLRGDQGHFSMCSEDHACWILRLWLLSRAERKRGLSLTKVWVSSGKVSASCRNK